MAVFMIMYMMNPAGLMPMTMVHNKVGSAAIAVGTFVVLAAGILLVDWPSRQGEPPPDPTFALGEALMGGADADDDDARAWPCSPRSSPPWCWPPTAAATTGSATTCARGAPTTRPGGCRPMTLELFLLLAAALFAIGLYGALSQQSIVMLMMGLELMLNGVIVAAAAFWYYVSPGGTDGQVLIVVVDHRDGDRDGRRVRGRHRHLPGPARST